jgi:hypothetical protein
VSRVRARSWLGAVLGYAAWRVSIVSAIPLGPSRLSAWPCLLVVAGVAGALCLLILCTLFLFLLLSWPRGPTILLYYLLDNIM